MIRIEKRQALARGAMGYRLSNGWILVAARARVDYGNGHRVSVWVPGCGTCAAWSPCRGSGGFTFVCGAGTLKEALALASARQDAADAELSRMAFGKEFR
jgi:hypothetical protein